MFSETTILAFYAGGFVASAGNVLCEIRSGAIGFNAQYAFQRHPIVFSGLLLLMVLAWPATLAVLYRYAHGCEQEQDED